MRTYNARNNNPRDSYDETTGARRSEAPHGNGRPRSEEDGPGGYDNERQAPAEPASDPNMNLRDGWSVAHAVRVKHITVTIWRRQGATGLAAYSLTLTRSFYSQRSHGYRTTTKLFAEDAPLAAEAFTRADDWLRQQAGDEAPPF
jgi:hypothetical protein